MCRSAECSSQSEGGGGICSSSKRRRRRHGRLNPNVVKIWRKNQGHGRSRSRHSGTRIKKNKYPFLFGKSEEEDVTTASSSSSFSYRGYTLGDISPPSPSRIKKISLFIRQSEARTIRKKKKKGDIPHIPSSLVRKKAEDSRGVFF